MRKEKVKFGFSKRMILAFVCTGVMALSGCGSSKSDSTTYDTASSKAVRGGGYSNSAGAESAVETAEYEESDVAYDDVVLEGSEGTQGSQDVSNKENSTNKIDTEKLIYRCNISLETQDFDGSISTFQQLIKQYEGFVESENTTIRNSGYGYDNGLGYYTATVRVPSSKYNDFVSSTGDIGNMTNKSQNVTNVSQEYSDLSVELEVLEAQKEDYMLMLKEAKSLQDMDNVILISDKIAQVSTSINQIKTRMNSIDNDVAYSYVDVVIEEVKEISEHTDETFATRFTKEVKQGWYDFGYACQQFIIWLVANIWGLLLFAGIIFLIVCIIKKLIKRSDRKAEERRQAQLEAMGVPVAPQPNDQSPYKKKEKHKKVAESAEKAENTEKENEEKSQDNK